MNFVKNNASRYPDQLLCEAHGLEALRRAALGTGIDVPNVVQVDQRTLTLPLIGKARCTPVHWQKLGSGLAALHSRYQPRFGLDADNYVGLNPQCNTHNDHWGDFFVRQRLEYQVGLIAKKHWQEPFSASLRRHGPRVREFLDAAAPKPSLVHGDLWNGNVLCAENDRVWLIDPAVYCADAEVDVAMTEMFGGFPEQFYAAYRASRPEPANWTQMKCVYNLYHYLNHLNIFGQAYLSGCEAGFAVLERL